MTDKPRRLAVHNKGIRFMFIILYVYSLGIEPLTPALLLQCTTNWVPILLSYITSSHSIYFVHFA